MQTTRTFKGILVRGHKGMAVEVPFDPSEVWGAKTVLLRPGRRGVLVAGELNGIPFESAVVGRMRRFFVLVFDSLAVRSGVTEGDSTDMVLWPAGPTARRPREKPKARSQPSGRRKARSGQSKDGKRWPLS